MTLCRVYRSLSTSNIAVAHNNDVLKTKQLLQFHKEAIPPLPSHPKLGAAQVGVLHTLSTLDSFWRNENQFYSMFNSLLCHLLKCFHVCSDSLQFQLKQTKYTKFTIIQVVLFRQR